MSGSSPAGTTSPAAATSPAGTTSPAGEDNAADQRQVPFFCPYCGDEELRPGGDKHGEWECRACSRGFQLRFTGVLS